MPSKKLNIQKISSWFYNCGLGTLVPHLLMHLCPDVSSLAQFVEAPPTPAHIVHFKNSQGYILLRESFLELYVSDENEIERIITEHEFEAVLSNLFETYTKALEQTMILGPALRLTLQKVLQRDVAIHARLWPYFTALIHRCLEHVQDDDFNTIDNYSYQDTEEILFLANKDKITGIISILKNSQSPEHASYQAIFASEACPDLFLDDWTFIISETCAYIGSMEIPTFLSVEHLGVLYRSFGFHLLYTTHNAPHVILPVYETRPQPHLRDVTIINQNKNHWELVCQNAKSVWEGNKLEDSDYLKIVHDFFFEHNDINHLPAEIIVGLQHGIQSFIKNNVNIFVSKCPEKIIKAWVISNPLQALAYKIDEILLLEDKAHACAVLGSTIGFINFLANFKAYYNIPGKFGINALKVLLKKYPNPHERSMILSKGFKPAADDEFVCAVDNDFGFSAYFSQYEKFLGAVYNNFGFDVKFSNSKIPYEICYLTTHSEPTYRVPVPFKAIESLQLNFDGTNWTFLELKTLYSSIRNICLDSLPRFVIEDEEVFKLSVKNTQAAPAVVASTITKSMFLAALQAEDLLLTEPTVNLPTEFYFAQDSEGDTPLHIAAELGEDTSFVTALTQLTAAALLTIREQQSKNWIKRWTVGLWQPNLQGETPLSYALKHKNFSWIEKFHEALWLCEAQARDPWVKEQFKNDINQLKSQLCTLINNIIASKTFSVSNKEELTKYFELDLMLREYISLTPGEKNAFHLAFKSKKYDEVLGAFEEAIERYHAKADARVLEQIKAEFLRLIPQIVNEYGRDLNFYLQEKASTRRVFENAYDQAKWQWSFSSTLQDTPMYRTATILKSIAEIPSNVATGGTVYAGIALGANVLGIPQIQKRLAQGGACIGGLAGKGVGVAFDVGSSYIWSTPVEVGPSYSQIFEHYGGQIGGITPTAAFTAAPWIFAFKLKLASVALGLAGANITRYYLPEYTNTQAFFYFLMSDIPFYSSFKAAHTEDPYYDRKIQFNNEQFFSKSIATGLTKTLQGIDFVSNEYKNMLYTVSNGTVNAFGSVPMLGTGLGHVQSGCSSFANTAPVKPMLRTATYIQNIYHEFIENSKESLEKQVLNLLPKSEQSDKRLYQLEFNKITRMMQDQGANQSAIDTALTALDLQFKESIGGKSLSKWRSALETQKGLEIHLSRLEQAEIVDESAIHQVRADLQASQEHSEQLWSDVELHNNPSVMAQAKTMKQEMNNKVKEIITREIKGSQSLKNWSTQHAVLKEAEIKLFNIENDKKSSLADRQKAQAEVSSESSKLETLWPDVLLYNDAAVVEHVSTTVQKIESDFSKIKDNVSVANQSLNDFSSTLKRKIETILGDYQKPRSFYADKITDEILNLQDPLNEWSPEKRQAEYDKIYKDVHDDALYGFETRGPQRRKFCRTKTHKYAFKQIKGTRAPVPDHKLGTLSKHFINEGFYTFFGCEPFQDIAQYTDDAINARFFITTAAVVGTLGVAAWAGIPVSIGLGGGGGAVGVGAAIGPKGSNPDALASFGPDAKGFQKTWNKTVKPYSFTKPADSYSNNNSFSDLAKPIELSMEPFQLRQLDSFSGAPALSLDPSLAMSQSPISFDFNMHNTYVASLPFSNLEEQVSGCIRNPATLQFEVKSNLPSVVVKPNPSVSKKKKEKQNPVVAQSKSATVQPVVRSKPVVTKPSSASPKLNAAARLTELNGGIPPESLQAGIMLSTVVHVVKDIGESVVSVVSESAQFSKDMVAASNESLPKNVRKAAQKRADKQATEFIDGIKTAAGVVGESLAHPVTAGKKYANSKMKHGNQAIEKVGKAIEQGDGMAAGAALAPVVHDLIEVSTIAAGGVGLVKAGVKASTTAIKAGTKVAKHKISVLPVSESVLQPVAKPVIFTKIPSKKVPVSSTKVPTTKTATVTATTNGLAHSVVDFDYSHNILSLNERTLPGLSTTSEAIPKGNLDFPRIIEHTKSPLTYNHVAPSATGIELLEPRVLGREVPDWVPMVDPVLLSQGPVKFGNPGTHMPLRLPSFEMSHSSMPKVPAVITGITQEAGKVSRGTASGGSLPFVETKPVHAGPIGIVGTPHPEYPGVICYSDRIYVEHVKHRPNKKGMAAWDGASINPISSYAEAQRLLDTAYSASDSQAFNVRMVRNSQGKILEKQIIRFHCENQDVWHCYELKKDFQSRMGNDIMTSFKKDGLITESEYGDLITNKWKK